MKVVKTKKQKRIKIPEDVCPITYIMDMGEIPKGTNIIFEKACLARIMLGHMDKTIKRKGQSLNITWAVTDENMNFIELNGSHTYLLSEMLMKKEDGKIFEFKCTFGEMSVIILE